jgi:hypothetical protein
MTTGPGVEVSVRRAVAVLVLGVAIAAGTAGITMLSLILRSVTAGGGSSADGGPSDPAQPCRPAPGRRCGAARCGRTTWPLPGRPHYLAPTWPSPS